MAPLNLEIFNLTRANNTLPLFGRVKEIKVYKTALTDAELTELTT